MNILLTGGNGFIGSNIKSYLLKKNHKIIEIRNLRTDSAPNNKSIKNSKVYFYDLKENNVETLYEKLKNEDIEVIIHCAAIVNNNISSVKDIVLTNSLGTNTLLLLCKLLKSKKFIYLSSLPVIGKPYNSPITEEHPTKPLSIYHASKLLGENIISFDNDNTFEKLILRITAPVGTNMPKNRFLSKLIIDCNANNEINLLGRGERIQNYIHTADICRFIEISIIKNCKGVFNLGGPESISNIDLAKLCIKKTNSKSNIIHLPPLPEGDMSRRMPDNSKMKKILGRDLISIENGIDLMIKDPDFIRQCAQ